MLAGFTAGISSRLVKDSYTTEKYIYCMYRERRVVVVVVEVKGMVVVVVVGKL